MANKRKIVELVTPVGTAQYPWLNTPDLKWDSDGQYRCNLILEDNEETDAFMAKLQQEWTAAADHEKEREGKQKARYGSQPWMAEEDEDGNETGRTVIKAKLKAIVRPKGGTPWKKRPVLIDAKKNEMGENIGGGSQVRLKLGVRGWFVASQGAGATLALGAGLMAGELLSDPIAP